MVSLSCLYLTPLLERCTSRTILLVSSWFPRFRGDATREVSGISSAVFCLAQVEVEISIETPSIFRAVLFNRCAPKYAWGVPLPKCICQYSWPTCHTNPFKQCLHPGNDIRQNADLLLIIVCLLWVYNSGCYGVYRLYGLNTPNKLEKHCFRVPNFDFLCLIEN